MQRLSVVITNFNYERFVGEAIRSALALEWGDVDVVVVDDGSTDGSRAVIDAFGDSITAIYTDNARQREAANRGFAVCTGDVVLFLDADDVLPPDLPQAIERCWSPLISKWQFRMQRMDADGRTSGAPFPPAALQPSPDLIRHWLVKTSAYPTPPGSGNAYSRWFLEKVLPAGPELGDAADSALLVAAPLLGQVEVVPDVVVRYRRHGANDSQLLADGGHRFSREVGRAEARWAYAHAVVKKEALPTRLSPGALRRSRELLQLRVASRRIDKRGGGESMQQLLFDTLRAPLHPGPEPLVQRLAISAWCLSALLAPPALLGPLLRFRYTR